MTQAENYKASSYGVQGILLGLFLACGPSVVFFYAGMPYTVLYCAFFLGVMLFNPLTRLTSALVPWVYACFLFAIFAFVGAILWGGDVMYAVPSLLCFLLFVAAASFDAASLRLAIRVYTAILLALLISAWVGFFLALLGFDSTISFANPGDRTARLYITTLANTYYQFAGTTVIRPSAIYDEPGALSFFAIAGVFLCEMMGGMRRRSWCLLILGFITVSLAHIIFFVVFVAHILGNFKRIWFLLAVVIGALFLNRLANETTVETNASGYIIKLTLLRLATSEDGLEGDNRSTLTINAVELLKKANPLLGIDSTCVSAVFRCRDIFGNFGENPLSPLVAGGLLGTGGIYLLGFIFLFAYACKTRMPWLFIGLGLMYLQRPYLFIAPQYTFPLVIGCAFWIRNRVDFNGFDMKPIDMKPIV